MTFFEQHLDAVIATGPPTAAVLFAWWKVHGAQKALHIDLNSRLTELIAATKTAAHAEGKAEGLAERKL